MTHIFNVSPFTYKFTLTKWIYQLFSTSQALDTSNTIQVTTISKPQRNPILSVFNDRHKACMCSKLMINSSSKGNSEPKYCCLWLLLHGAECVLYFVHLFIYILLRSVTAKPHFPKLRNTHCSNYLFLGQNKTASSSSILLLF
jgi:hypothetical protein